MSGDLHLEVTADLLDAIADRVLARLADKPTTTPTQLTTTQAAARATVHDRTIRRALAAGALTGRTTAGRWRITTTDLDAWLERGAPTTTTSAVTSRRVTQPRASHANRPTGADAIAGRHA